MKYADLKRRVAELEHELKRTQALTFAPVERALVGEYREMGVRYPVDVSFLSEPHRAVLADGARRQITREMAEHLARAGFVRFDAHHEEHGRTLVVTGKLKVAR